jgi:hypothetical protein
MVMFLYPKRNRILTASFPADLNPEQLRETVAELRQARHGLESWIVPALEWVLFQEFKSGYFPKLRQIIPDLLASCRELPVAARWKRIRENVRASAKRDALKSAEEGIRLARAPRRRTSKVIRPRKPLPRKA